jgi:CHASE2 domain-containing sensor protein
VFQVLRRTELEIQTQDGVRTIGPGTEAFDEIVLGKASADAQDQELTDAVASGVPVVMAAQTVSGPGVQGVIRPYASLLAASRNTLGLAGVRLDDDGVLRRYLPYGVDESGNLIYGLAVVAVSKYLDTPLPRSPLPGGDVLLGDETVVEVENGSFLVNFPGPPGTHLTVTAGDILNGRPEIDGLLTGKIVFIGVSDPSAEDVVPTPYSGTDRMAGVEFHAAAAGTILQNRFIETTSTYQVVLIIVGLSLVAVPWGDSSDLLTVWQARWPSRADCLGPGSFCFRKPTTPFQLLARSPHWWLAMR